GKPAGVGEPGHPARRRDRRRTHAGKLVILTAGILVDPHQATDGTVGDATAVPQSPADGAHLSGRTAAVLRSAPGAIRRESDRAGAIAPAPARHVVCATGKPSRACPAAEHSDQS